MPTVIIAPGSTENELVISATMIITANGACATLPKHAIIATTTKTPGPLGIPGSPARSANCQMAAPTKAPMTIPGPKMPPEPPLPIDSDVARIFANGRISTIHSGIFARLSVAVANWTQP